MSPVGFLSSGVSCFSNCQSMRTMGSAAEAVVYEFSGLLFVCTCFWRPPSLRTSCKDELSKPSPTLDERPLYQLDVTRWRFRVFQVARNFFARFSTKKPTLMMCLFSLRLSSSIKRYACTLDLSNSISLRCGDWRRLPILRLRTIGVDQIRSTGTCDQPLFQNTKFR